MFGDIVIFCFHFFSLYVLSKDSKISCDFLAQDILLGIGV